MLSLVASPSIAEDGVTMAVATTVTSNPVTVWIETKDSESLSSVSCLPYAKNIATQPFNFVGGFRTFSISGFK